MTATVTTTRGMGVWDLPHLDTDRCLVRFTRDLFSADHATLAALAERRRGAAALVLVDEGVAVGRPELLDDVRARGMSPVVVPGGHAMRHGATAVRDITAAVEALVPDGAGLLVAVGGAGMFTALDQAVAASGREVRKVWVPTTVHGLVTALDAGVMVRAQAVLTDFELLRSLSDRDWCAGIPPAVEAALVQDRAFFWWLERQTEELRRRSLPAIAWVMYRTAQLRLSGRPQRLGVPLRPGAARRGEAASVSVALGVAASYLRGRLPYLELRRVIDLLERLDLPVWGPRVALPSGGVSCGILGRIGAGVTVERLDAAALDAAADLLRERTFSDRAASGTRRACRPSPPRTRGR